MRKVEELDLKYMGYKEPETEDELVFEVLGLELAIKTAEQRIALLKLSFKATEMKTKELAKQKSEE